MHRQLAAQLHEPGLVAARLQRDQDPDLAEPLGHAGVDVGADDAVLDLQMRGAAQVHVFADGGDQAGELFRDRAPAAGIGLALECLEIAAGLQRQLRNLRSEGLEVLVSGNEVRFRVDLDGGARGSGHGGGNQSLRRGASRLLGGRGESLLAQPVDPGLQVPAGLGQRLLAVHHAGTGLLAQLLHQGGSDLSHLSSTLSPLYARPRRPAGVPYLISIRSGARAST